MADKRKVDPHVMWGFTAGYKACCGEKCPEHVYDEWLKDE